MKNMYKYFVVLFLPFAFSLPVHASSNDPWTWEEVRFGGIVEQGLDNSCGLASLLTIMRSHFVHQEQFLLSK